jgi:predicted nucleotidyltransferase
MKPGMDELAISAHPVDPDARVRILACLQDLEERRDVTILFACESGSRGWGFASPDSDYDVRFIYLNRLSWYLTVEPGRDVIEQPISGDLDVSGWDLRKALQLLRRSNPTLMEWLRSPIVYREDAAAAPRLRALAEESFSAVRCYQHYLSMAKRNFREHLLGEEVRYKKYFYVLRPLLAARWIREGRGVAPMQFAELVRTTLEDGALIGEINRLRQAKMGADESATSARWDAIHGFIEAELAAAQAHVFASEERPDRGSLDAFLREAILQNERQREGHD